MIRSYKSFGARRPDNDPLSIALNFTSDVLDFVPTIMPENRFTLAREVVDYCQETFGYRPIVSHYWDRSHREQLVYIVFHKWIDRFLFETRFKESLCEDKKNRPLLYWTAFGNLV